MKPRLAQALQAVAALGSFAAAGAHGLVTGEHFDEWWGYGVFFIVAAFAQTALGILLLAMGPPTGSVPAAYSEADWRRLQSRVYVAGIVGNGAVIALYVVTRTVGIPLFGPEAGEVEDIGTVDLVSKVMEVLAIVAMGWLWVSMRGGTVEPLMPQGEQVP
ncbi:MAG TPA: hypothetical protein VI796_04070 [Candidatus Thermoplasmatota archaeon]|nr:hypothetical protein [Candidatus Thermoplasmatota archaeon]